LSIVAWMIIISEILFWVTIILGLFARYVLKRNKLGLILLAATPVIDCILLATTSIDLYRGATASTVHAVAAVYIGVSLAFGKSMISWADNYFRYYVTKQGAKPAKRYGTEHAKHYFKSWIRHVFAFLIGVGILQLLILLIDDATRTESLASISRIWLIVLGIDFIFAISYFIWPKKSGSSPKSVPDKE